VQTQDWELMDNSVWRLIPLLSASGSVQMAIDQWLLEQHLAGKIRQLCDFTLGNRRRFPWATTSGDGRSFGSSCLGGECL
jgi:hypothetical protein